MQGIIIYNHSLTAATYLENIHRFSMYTGLQALSNKELCVFLQKNNVNYFPFDFCIFLDKDIALARYLENCGIRVFNTAAAIETCDNKAYTCIALAGKVPLPDTYIPPLSYFGPAYACPIPFPVVVKECFGSWGQQVYLARNTDEYNKTLQNIGSKPFLIQEYIETNGTDYRIYTVGGKAVAAMKRHNDHDFRANCELGGIAQACTPTPQMIKLAENTSDILGLNFGGIDIIETPEGPVVIEANSSAMTLQIERTTGINIPKLLLNYIQQILGY